MNELKLKVIATVQSDEKVAKIKAINLQDFDATILMKCKTTAIFKMIGKYGICFKQYSDSIDLIAQGLVVIYLNDENIFKEGNQITFICPIEEMNMFIQLLTTFVRQINRDFKGESFKKEIEKYAPPFLNFSISYDNYCVILNIGDNNINDNFFIKEKCGNEYISIVGLKSLDIPILKSTDKVIQIKQNEKQLLEGKYIIKTNGKITLKELSEKIKTMLINHIQVLSEERFVKRLKIMEEYLNKYKYDFTDVDWINSNTIKYACTLSHDLQGELCFAIVEDDVILYPGAIYFKTKQDAQNFVNIFNPTDFKNFMCKQTQEKLNNE